MLRAGVAAIALGAGLSTPVFAQDQSQAQSAPSGEGIIVQAERLRGQLDVEQAPILELNEADIEASGATSIAELIEIISPQTTSSRGRGGGGRPVFLVNGVRIGSFRELRSYPPEAIVKVEVMPEEVAQKFGFPPDRRVVNLILKDNFATREVEAEYEQPSEGGFRKVEGEFTYIAINKGDRINLNVEVEDRTTLTEDERDIIQTDGSVSNVTGDPSQAPFRSLVSDDLSFEASGNWAKTLIDSGTSLSLNTTYEREEQRSLSGLNSVTLVAPDGLTSEFRTFGAGDPLEVRTTTDSIASAGSWTRPLGSWQLNTTFDASITDTISEIDRRAETGDLVEEAALGLIALDAPIALSTNAGFDRASTQSIAAGAKSTLRGTLADLPAGELSTTLDVGYNWDRIDSSDTRSGTETQLTRGDLEAGINVVIPLTSSRELFLDTLGSFTLNGQAGINHYSDFGTLNDWSLGLNWSPFDNLDLQATYIRAEVAPSLANLGNPLVETLNVPVFDFVNGETVLATVISGGNPALLAETQRDWKFSANWELPFWNNTRLSAEYINNRSDDVTGSFPALTAEAEAAFGDRVTRDVDGTLLRLDRRAVTYAQTRSKSLVFGFTTRGSWGGARPQAGGRPQGAGRPQGSGRPQGAGGPEGRRGPPSPEQRAQFMAMRERLCADDGMALLTRLVDAVESGQDPSAIIPNFDAERFKRILSRVRAEDGTIDPQRLEQFRSRICSMDPAQMRGGQQGGQPGGPPAQAAQGGARRGGGGRPGFGGRDGRGRYFINISHSYQLDNEVLIAQGIPLLDQLDGDSLSSTGVARLFTQLQAGVFRSGFGMRLSGFRTGKARVNGNEAIGTSPLFFGQLTRFNLRLFTNLGQVLKKEEGVFKNLRMSLRADNVFNARRKVVDENGDTPTNFQPALLDPTGRYVGIQFRKLF